MTNGSERLDRIERILEQGGENQADVSKSQAQVAHSLQEMAARQQYHDEAFERHHAEMN